MAKNRMTLQRFLKTKTANVYFQPDTNIKLKKKKKNRIQQSGIWQIFQEIRMITNFMINQNGRLFALNYCQRRDFCV